MLPDTSEHTSARDADEGFLVRRARPGDGPQIERLVDEGVLPGHVDYESHRADEIRRSLGSERDVFLVAEATGGRSSARSPSSRPRPTSDTSTGSASIRTGRPTSGSSAHCAGRRPSTRGSSAC